jgi:hypothetical protein
MPLVEAAGTVIALVNPASPSSVATTYTYDTSGVSSTSGTSSTWPFLYHGTEQETIDPGRSFAEPALSECVGLRTTAQNERGVLRVA